MPEIEFHGDKNTEKPWLIVRHFEKMPIHSDGSVLVFRNSATGTTGNNMPFVRIEGSIDMSDEDLIKIADYFNQIIDVSIRFSWGPMVFREKGKGFGKEAIEEAEAKMIGILNRLGFRHR
jgi:hypothetical protein